MNVAVLDSLRWMCYCELLVSVRRHVISCAQSYLASIGHKLHLASDDHSEAIQSIRRVTSLARSRHLSTFQLTYSSQGERVTSLL